MNRNFIIYSDHPEQKACPVYYESTTFKSSDWDTYGSQPAKSVRWTSLVRDAKLFGTRVEALDVLEKDLSDLTEAHVSHLHVVQITDKQLFKAALTEE